jgi:hypothetical protein
MSEPTSAESLHIRYIVSIHALMYNTTLERKCRSGEEKKTKKARLAERWLLVQRRKVVYLNSFKIKKGRENASSQRLSTKRYGAEVTNAAFPRKARTTFNKWVPIPETDTCR